MTTYQDFCEDFRQPQFVTHKEDVSYQLNRSLNTTLSNGASQVKTSHQIIADSTNDTMPNDLYDAFLEVDFKIEKMDGTGYAAADDITLASDGYSLIKEMLITFNTTPVSNTTDVNQCVNVKNILEYSDSFARNTATSSFMYPDSGTGQAIAANNAGFAMKKSLTSTQASNNIILKLNRYPFFNSFEREICPLGKLALNITLETDANLLYKSTVVPAGGAAPVVGRVVVTKLVLWIPKIELSEKYGRKYYLQRMMEAPNRTYHKNILCQSPSIQQATGTFEISSMIEKPRHVIIWATNDNKIDSQNHNIFLFDTYKIGGNTQCTSAQLKMGGDKYYPQQPLNPNEEKAKVYRGMLDYAKGNNDYLSGSFVNYSSFQNLYPLIYFDLSKQAQLDGAYSLQFKYALNGQPTSAYRWKALVLSEQDIHMDTQSGRAILRF